MKPDELYNLICDTDYRTSGFDLNWQIIVSEDEKIIRLLFECSTTTKDWIVNILGFVPIPKFIKFRLIFFCFGWKSVFDSCSDLIMEELIRCINLNPDYRVEICGHSYGGAMSIIAGIDLFKRTSIKADITTFGSPRPLFLFFSKLMAKTCLGNVVQYAHRSDFVTFCPPLLGYHNVKVKKVGKFDLIGMFSKGSYYHTSYGDASLY